MAPTKAPSVGAVGEGPPSSFSFWQPDRPPPAPDAAVVARDLSCQGMMGLTLQKALQDLFQQQQQQQQEETATERNSHRRCANAAAAADGDDGDDETQSNDDNENVPASDRHHHSLQLSSSVVARIMQSFGEGVAQSQQQQQQQQQQQRQESVLMGVDNGRRRKNSDPDGAAVLVGNGSMSSDVSLVAPAALLRGRLDHYNRYNNKWRLVVQDAQLRERCFGGGRPFLDRNRRKRERPSLWQVANEQQQQQQQRQRQQRQQQPQAAERVGDDGSASAAPGGDPWPKVTLEILAYNDLE